MNNPVLNVVMISFEKDTRKNMSSLLMSMAEINQVSAFNSLPKAEKYLRQQGVGFVLLDADDEEIGWIIPFRRIKTIHPNLKIILMSSSRDAAVKAYETGVWDYLLKPVKESQIKRIIERCR